MPCNTACDPRTVASTTTRSSAWRSSTGRASSSRAPPPIRARSTSRASAGSRTRWGRRWSWTWRTSRGSSPPDSPPTPGPMPASSRARRPNTPAGPAAGGTSTPHKTLRGRRGGVILCRGALAEKVDKSVFPGLQGGPLMHIIAAKAVCFGEALTDEFRDYARRVLENAHVLAEALVAHGHALVSGGTDTHLLLPDLRRAPGGAALTGKVAEEALHRVGITVNKNAAPDDPQKPWVTSGIRIGTPALTTRGMGVAEMRLIAGWIARVLEKPADEGLARDVGRDVRELAQGYPLFSRVALPGPRVRAG